MSRSPSPLGGGRGEGGVNVVAVADDRGQVVNHFSKKP
jgi:hypothetical protein